MPTRKISDNRLPIAEVCLDPQHYPATMVVRDAGTYEHTCPACGKMTHFVVVERRIDSKPWKIKTEVEKPHSWEGGDPNIRVTWGGTLMPTPA